MEAVLETIVLVVTSAAYMVFIPVCVSMFGRAERRLIRILGNIEYKLDRTSVVLPAEYSPQAAEGAAAGGEIRMRCDQAKELLRITLAAATAQRRRFVAACVIVLLAFFIRASFDLLNAYANVNSSQNSCGSQCDPCQSDQWLIMTWLGYTPEFQATAVALSSPLPLVVSLWLMMTKEDRLQLVSPATKEHERLLPDQNQNRVLASRKNMAIDLL